MDNKFKIRKATEADYEQISKIFEQGDQHHENVLPQYFSSVPNARSLPDIMFFIDNVNADFFLAIQENIPIGILSINKSETPPFDFFKAQEFALIDSIIIDEKFRGQGIGRVLLNQAKEWSLKQGLKSIQLTVWEANTQAISFYKKHGFNSLSRKMILEL
jgi:diamine N-acetyltransferase